MKNELKREAPISIYPPIILYNTKDVDRIWEEKNIRSQAEEPANLYVHIPFCAQRCDFCYFTSFTAGDSTVRAYVEALQREILLLSKMPVVQRRRFHTVYIGGGTPTYLKTPYLSDIIQSLWTQLNIQREYEFCVEVRPGKEATEEKLRFLHEAGVNRISMGAQSFSQEVLDINGRKHKLEDFFTVYERLREIGFANINIDIMSGMAGDTDISWKDSIDTVLRLAPENITVYKMHVYKSSELYKKLDKMHKTGSVVEDEIEVGRIRYFYERMREAGYKLSATPYTFTKSRAFDHSYRASRTGGDEVLGIGLSANSFMNGTVYQNTNSMEVYVNKLQEDVLPVKSAYVLPREEEIKRALVFGLKTSKIDRKAFLQRYGADPVDICPEGFERMLRDGCIETDEAEIRLCAEACLYADDIVRRYILSEKERQMERLLVLHKNVRLKI